MENEKYGFEESSQSVVEVLAIDYRNETYPMPQYGPATEMEAWNEQGEIVIDAFKAGWAACESWPQWISVHERLPERVEGKRYSQVACLTSRKGNVAILVFNHEHECWDQEDGDDFECAINEVDYWMPLPVSPLKDKTAK